MHAAWSNRPKIQVHLDLHAPKVAIPIIEEEDSADPSALQTLFIDFGSLVITSNHLEGSSLSPEEAAIYDCYGLLSYDIAVYVIKGPFVWPEMTHTLSGSLMDVGLPSPGQLGECRSRLAGELISDYLGPSAIAVPLLGQCSTTASVHLAHVSHPTLPFVRIGLEVCLSLVCSLLARYLSSPMTSRSQAAMHTLQGSTGYPFETVAPGSKRDSSLLQVPEITLHVSPYRLTQLLLVMQTLMPTTDSPSDPAPWVKSAEYTSTVDVLAWQGLTGASSQWQPRFAVVYRGTLYVMQSEGSPVIIRQVALWQGRRVLPLPEDLTGQLFCRPNLTMSFSPAVSFGVCDSAALKLRQLNQMTLPLVCCLCMLECISSSITSLHEQAVQCTVMEIAGGVPHVLAVLPSHIQRDRAIEEASAVILRLQSDYMLQEWTRRLRHSAAQMHSVALWHSKQVPSTSLGSRQIYTHHQIRNACV